MLTPGEITYNYQRVMERIIKVSLAAGRDPGNISLIVVTKTHPVEVIKELTLLGVHHIGESYVNEGIPKIMAFSDQLEIVWHMVGHVQSRKARLVCEHFDYVHSLDNLKLARLLNRSAEENGRVLPGLLECNVSGEQSKYGWPIWSEMDWEKLIPVVEEVISLPYLDIKGLMTIAPYLLNPEDIRPFFKRLREFRDFLSRRFPKVKLDDLSMGMSGDFEVAIQEGATWIRIGQAILGPRER